MARSANITFETFAPLRQGAEPESIIGSLKGALHFQDDYLDEPTLPEHEWIPSHDGVLTPMPSCGAL